MTIRSRAPLRLSFAGDATDVVPYVDREGGVILSATIDKFVYASITENECQGDDYTAFEFGETLNIYKADELIQASIKRMDAMNKNINIQIQSDAPAGSGFGSTSTTVVAVLGALREYLKLPIADHELAQMAYDIERNDVGLLGGRQDHYLATFGGIDFIEFIDSKAIVNKLKIPQNITNELEYSLLLCHTGRIEQSQRILNDQMNDYSANKEKLDLLKELTLKMKNHLLRGELGSFGRMLDEVWTAKRSL